MLNDSGLSNRARAILFWFTIAMIVIVAIAAIVTILRACNSVLSPPEIPLTISPGEISLCPGEQRQFTSGDNVEVTWGATGGMMSDSIFTAGDTPGDYTVTATAVDTEQKAEAIVHVVACTPPPTLEPSPAPAPTDTPTPEAIALPPTDPQGDVGAYENGAPVEGVPAGLDISSASLNPDARVALQPTEGTPAELTGWVADGEILLWIALHTPIPDPPPVYMNWLFSLDVDGNTATGRPAGSRRINPDLGDEAVIGVSYDPATGSYEPYFLIWDAGQGNWVSGPEGIRYYLSDSRTVVALALPLETLTQSAAQTSGVTLVLEAVKGRAAADSYAGEQRVIDFYPALP
ncbi:MAG: hypothetical protein B6I35_11065 [Anaerolineaceae bacterium 4572_32.2]|nr:MAG: hypothetical protein B6I35_11065 [Anaerolineaceae bacterium 4572_32.2]HEY72251.1 hypothetical protein [Thermoflexia bacterium]